MHFLLFLIFGLVVGAIARIVVPGREPGGWVVSLLLGVAGAYVGGFIGQAVGLYGPGRSTGGFFLSIFGAILVVATYQAIASRRRL